MRIESIILSSFNLKENEEQPISGVLKNKEIDPQHHKNIKSNNTFLCVQNRLLYHIRVQYFYFYQI
jgi:hypothetical protein